MLFPTSPTPSNSSFTSSATFDSLKSSLRDTLQIDGHSRNSSVSVPRHRQRRSVSFAVGDIVDDSNGLLLAKEQSLACTSTEPDQRKQEPEPSSGMDSSIHIVDFVASGASSSGSPVSITTSPMTSTFSSPVRKRLSYPVQHWEPLSPETGDITAEERANLPGPLELAGGLFIGMDVSEPEPEKASAPQRLNGTRYAKHRHQPPVIERGLFKMTLQTLIGLWLAVIWLILGRLLGPSRKKDKKA